MRLLKQNQIIVGVIIIVAVIGLMYFYTASDNKNILNNNNAEIGNTGTDQVNEEAIAPTIVPPIIDAPNNWEVFTKNDLDYGFAYRSDWNVDEVSNQYTRISHQDFKIEIVRQSKSPEESLEEYSEKQAQGSEMRTTVTNQERIIIDGFPALSEINSWIGGSFSARVVYVQKDNYVYHIVLSTSHKESDVSASSIQTFLNNFKFAMFKAI